MSMVLDKTVVLLTDKIMFIYYSTRVITSTTLQGLLKGL